MNTKVSLDLPLVVVTAAVKQARKRKLTLEAYLADLIVTCFAPPEPELVGDGDCAVILTPAPDTRGQQVRKREIAAARSIGRPVRRARNLVEAVAIVERGDG